MNLNLEEYSYKNNNSQQRIKIMQNYSHTNKIQQEKHEQNFWDRINEEMQVIDAEKEEFKTQELPLSRIKRLMKLESEILDESAKYMVSSEAPILFAKACEIFILELTLRAWKYADDEKRRTLLSSDITKAVSRSEMYDFLIDIIPREDIQIQEYLQHIKTGSTLSNVSPQLTSDPVTQVIAHPPLPLRPLTTSQTAPPVLYTSQPQHPLAPTPTYVPYTYVSQNSTQHNYSQQQQQQQSNMSIPPPSIPLQSYSYPNYQSSTNSTTDQTSISNNNSNNNNDNNTYYQQQHQQHHHHIPDNSSSSSYSSPSRANIYPTYPPQHQSPHGS